LWELPFRVVRYTLKYQAGAWKRCFREGAGFAKFKSRHRGRPSFTIPKGARLKNGNLLIPKAEKMMVRRKGGNPYEGSAVVTATIHHGRRKWYVAVMHKIPTVENTADRMMGLDRNVRQITCSDGRCIDTPGTGKMEAKP